MYLLTMKLMTINLNQAGKNENGQICPESGFSSNPHSFPRWMRVFFISTEGALLCPSIAESEAQLLDGLQTATIHSRRGLVAPLLKAAQKVVRDIQTKKGHSLVI
jgi:hypothetical protein